MRSLFVLIALFFFAGGCSDQTTSTFSDMAADAGPDAAPEAGGACTTSTDCGSGHACGFRMLDGCSAQGVCVQKDVGACFGAPAGCACDGTLTSDCGMVGYTDKPFAHVGPCDDGGSDASTHAQVDQ